jgi:signal transduction histidine kinase
MTTIALGVLLLTINGLALYRIAGARKDAERAARAQHEAATVLDARAVEATCGSLRDDFLYLTNGLSQLGIPARLAVDNAFVARWTRLDAEGRILVFLQSHEEVERIVVTVSVDRPVIVTGRRGGAPIVLPPASPLDAAIVSRRSEPSQWPIGSTAQPSAWLRGWVDPDRLLARAVPGAAERGVRIRLGVEGGPDRDDDALLSQAAIVDTTWSPPIHWTLVHESEVGRVVDSVREVSERYRQTVLFNAVLLGLASIAAALMFREVRRAAQSDAERRHAERMREVESGLRHSERLASLGRMAAGIAHEINNPLEGMANYLAIADQDLQDGDVDAARTDLGRVREGLERVAGIVRRVLRLASPGRGHGELVDLNEIVTSAGELARGTPSGKGRTVIIRTASAAPRVPGDPTTLGQLVLNLLVNAMEADTNGRDVEVETRETEQHLEVRVSDRGPGLPAGERERLFEPFWSTKGSTGLGLAISHGIALEHGGTLRAEDRPGGGAVFVLTIPRAPKSDGPRAAIRNEASP